LLARVAPVAAVALVAAVASAARTVRVAGVRAPLFVAGDETLLEQPLVAIVGTRRPTPAGVARASRLARELAGAGVVVASGLAFGIDAAAHRGALAAGGRTVAVLGTPLDTAYPAAHAALQAEIARRHAVLSPFAPGARIARGNFPRRDRVLAVIARAVVVVEAGDGSGALYTAGEAVRIGRPLFLLRSLVLRAGVEPPGSGWIARFLDRPGVSILTETAEVLRAL
jgi:DNA processing protein